LTSCGGFFPIEMASIRMNRLRFVGDAPATGRDLAPV